MNLIKVTCIVLSISFIVLNCYVLLVFKYPVASSMDNSDAVVLLAGDYGERLSSVATISHKSSRAIVLITNDGVVGRWSSKYNRNLSQAEWAKEKLADSGVARDRIIILPFKGSSTMHDALRVYEYSSQTSLRRLTIVTSNFHVRRAYWSFRKIFKPTDYAIQIYSGNTRELKYRKLLLEHIKMLYYSVRYINM